jgi:restriction endonuclease S subunit
MENLTKFETYKPSGIDWIGEVPNHWRIQRLKDLVLQKITDGPHETPELVDDEDSIPFISAEAITEDGINYEARGGNISAEQDRIYSLKCKPKKHDIFIVKSGSTTGRIGYVEIDLNFNIWSPLALVRSNKQTSSRFLFHYLSSDCIQRQIQNTWSFGTQPNIGMGVIERLRLSMPPSEEQLTIANYLDQQTQKIDRLIANKKAQAEKLKELRQIEINNAVTKGLNPNAEMKESGIDWLGKIPKHWAVKRLKNILVEKMMYGANEIADEDDEQNPRYIRITDFGSNGELRDDTFKSLPFEVAKGYLLQEGDILFARSGATVGKTFQFRNYKGIACFAGYLIKARPNFNIITSDFMFFFTQSNGYENWKNSIFSKATIENIGADKYQLLKLSVPPTIDEQNKITQYLQKRTTAIDILIKNIDAQIEKLQELRKIKIYEAVTGKVKVNAYDEATA